MQSEDMVSSGETSTSPDGVGRLMMTATLPGDRDAAGDPWRAVLVEAGHRVQHLGVRAAPVVVSHVADLAPQALVVWVEHRQARGAVQALVAHLVRRSLRIPLLLGGPGVDAEFAQWVAMPVGSTLYWGGVYYCEDADEMLEVLRQIVLFEPAPSDHVHEAPEAQLDDCSVCGGCPLATSCDAQV